MPRLIVFHVKSFNAHQLQVELEAAGFVDGHGLLWAGFHPVGRFLFEPPLDSAQEATLNTVLTDHDSVPDSRAQLNRKRIRRLRNEVAAVLPPAEWAALNPGEFRVTMRKVAICMCWLVNNSLDVPD
jgi:hypothetical protein